MTNKPKVLVMMSGGVDSSVAAYLLKKTGKYNVTGIYIKGYNLDGCADRDIKDAQSVAFKIGIPFYVWDFEKEYKRRVVDYMINSYKNGLTPNPDVMCNKEIKFGLFFDKAIKMGADYVATGHYVKIKKDKNIFYLYQAKDKNKDQSYFLWTLKQNQLKHCLFPIGNYLKSEVRKIAQKAELPVAFKKDSQGICFLGKIKLADFLKKKIRPKKGRILNQSGETIGYHNGAWFYTIGQRHINAKIKNYQPNSQPLYVIDKNIKQNTITVSLKNNCPPVKRIFLKNTNIIDPIFENQFKKRPQNIWVRFRYRQPLIKAILIYKKYPEIEFKLPVSFVSLGQSAVFYNNKEKMIGGGEIIKTS